MKPIYLLMCLLTLDSNAVSGPDLRDVLVNPKNYNERHVDLIGIARVPGYFYLFWNKSAAANTNLSKALLVRKNNLTGPEYRELDRQWVRVTGVISSKPRHGWDSGRGLLLKRVELVPDRPPPHIKDPSVLALFQNATAQPFAMQLRTASQAPYQEFFLTPHAVDKTVIHEGEVVVAELKRPATYLLMSESRASRLGGAR